MRYAAGAWRVMICVGRMEAPKLPYMAFSEQPCWCTLFFDITIHIRNYTWWHSPHVGWSEGCAFPSLQMVISSV